MLLVLTLLGCIEHLDQVAGTGSIYSTKCSADMEAEKGQYTAPCVPTTCSPGYTDAGISHVVVAIDPGRRIIGYAERSCVQDLHNAAALFEAPDAEKARPTK